MCVCLSWQLVDRKDSLQRSLIREQLRRELTSVQRGWTRRLWPLAAIPVTEGQIRGCNDLMVIIHISNFLGHSQSAGVRTNTNKLLQVKLVLTDGSRLLCPVQCCRPPRGSIMTRVHPALLYRHMSLGTGPLSNGRSWLGWGERCNHTTRSLEEAGTVEMSPWTKWY